MESTDKWSAKGWTWVLSLFAAGGIPTAIVSFVSLLVFVQCGCNYSLAALLYALLFLPSVLKSLVHPLCLTVKECKRQILIAQLLLLSVHYMLIVSFTVTSNVKVVVFLLLMLISASFCAWHELLAEHYYSNALTRYGRRALGGVKVFASLAAQVLTYGLLIVIAGNFQWYFRYMDDTLSHSWAFVIGLVSVVMMICLLANLKMPVGDDACSDSVGNNRVLVFGMAELMSKLKGIWNKRMPIAVCALMLLPQSLLFATRLFFLLSDKDEGGLGCSLMDVGFAQGTVGVIAFSFGIVIGHFAIKRYGWKRAFPSLAVVLGLSPLFYFLMAIGCVSDGFFAVCVMTFLSQLCFGMGVNSCRMLAEHISGKKYSSTVNVLNIPLVALAMVLPIALSGVLLSCMGFERFFALCVLMAIFPVVTSLSAFNRKTLVGRIVTE
ncbi:MAG: hypothetical protein IJZ68_11945 [Bacteroidaceae bacterium]|nr:hypothetical protein [Bacteroidaceae bacterium]